MSPSAPFYKRLSFAVTPSRPESSLVWLIWHVLAVVALIVMPVRLGLDLGFDRTPLLRGFIVSYCATVLILTIWFRRGRAIRLVELASIFSLVFGTFFLYLLLSRIEYSRSVFVLSMMIVSGFLILSLTLKGILQKGVLCIVTLPMLVVAMAGAPDASVSSDLVIENRLIRTNLYRLAARYYRNFGREEVTGGAIAQFGDRYLLATGDGELQVFSWEPSTKELQRHKLSTRVPINRDEFVRDAAPRKAFTRSFRIADILVQDLGDHFRLFASHHYWNSKQQCSTLRISATTGKYADFGQGSESAQWETIYDSVPCLTFKSKGDPFGGEQVGGRMVMLDEHRLLVAVGDQKYDGVEAEENLPQDKTAHNGKTILLDVDTHQASIYSLGHRNPQGLTIDAAGDIWETEHGPQGGDELNQIQEGKNYGWPFVTYGRNYGELVWPLNPKPGRHEGYEMPAYAWVPSIGVSNLIHVQGGLLEYWKDDLLVAALGDKSIWRVRTDRGRTELTERFIVRERIRDIMQDSNGRIILWTEELELAPTQTAIVVIEPVVSNNPDVMVGLNRVDRGELVFDQCSGCHRVEDGLSHGIGPDLKFVFGQPVGTARGYGYSDAMKGFSGKWTAEALDAFLANPQGFMPGTTMQFDGLSDSVERADLIEYLKNQN